MDVVAESIMLDVVETLVALKDTGTLVLAVVDVCTTPVTLDVVEILDVVVTLAEVDVGGVVSAGGQSLADNAIQS